MSITSIQIIIRAVAAGTVAGLLAALFVALVAEDSINESIALENQFAAEPHDDGEEDNGHSHNDGDEPLVSRDTQVVGGVVAAILYGLFTGVTFGTVFAAVRHRIRAADDFRRVLLFAAAAYLATSLLPALKYPANPPAVGDPATVNQRTLQYLTLIAALLVVAFGVASFFNQMRERFDQSTSVLLAALVGLLAVTMLLVIWPDNPDTIDQRFPAALLWRFRLESMATLAIAWSTFGLGLGWLLTRLSLTNNGVS